jgi:hypothetical protein
MILEKVSELTPGAPPGDAEKALKDVISSNPAERRILIQILGYSGIMIPRNLTTYWRDYPKYFERKDPPNSKNDWSYPVAWWRGADGINMDAVKFWFPEFHSPRLQ